MTDLKSVIHKDFYHQTGKPVICETVGEVIEQLSRLPKELAVRTVFDDLVRITVCNISREDTHVIFTEPDF